MAARTSTAIGGMVARHGIASAIMELDGSSITTGRTIVYIAIIYTAGSERISSASAASIE